MNNTLSKTIKVSLLSLMISGTAMADGALAPIGALQAGDNVTIQNELGSFPITQSYTVMAGDQIKTSVGDVATLAVNGGNIYISPNSSATVSESNGLYTVELLSGSIGYNLEGESTIKVISSGKEITPVAVDGSITGAIALGSNDKLVVSPIVGNALVVASDGIVTTIEQGKTWTNTAQGGKITLTQAEEEDDNNALWIMLGGLAGAALIINKKDESTPSSPTPPPSVSGSA
ncbi:MAG: hypothetical protein GY697_19355 [Desulfobacterales bacterium]|nr:hypothetical protein [Desulfobacterales bacterium]